MSLRLRPGHRVFVFSEYIDLRSGFEKLSMLIRERMRMDLLEGDLFLFLGNNSKKIKGICFDGTGLILINKRLEKGSFMRIAQMESSELTHEELDQLFNGSVIRRRKFGEEALTSFHKPSMLSPTTL